MRTAPARAGAVLTPTQSELADQLDAEEHRTGEADPQLGLAHEGSGHERCRTTGLRARALAAVILVALLIHGEVQGPRVAPDIQSKTKMLD